MTLKTLILIAALAMATVGHQPAVSHEVAKGPNGGQVVDAGDYHVELVAKQNIVEVFVRDGSDNPVPATGFKGTAILIVDGKQQRITLEASDGNRLAGKASTALPARPRGVVQLTAPGDKTVQGRFN